MRHAQFLTAVALVAATALSGCNEKQVAQDDANTGGTSNSNTSGTTSHHVASLQLPSGSSIDITLGTPLTSETAAVGNAWSGSVRNAFVVDGKTVIPAGSLVDGTVTSVQPARKGDRAMLNLGLSSISVDGHSYRVRGTTEAIVAGSTRARNLGAIGAATVAGAVIGHQVGKSDKGTIIGGLIGGGTATGVVSQTKGWQVVLKSGTPLTFTTNETVAVRP